MKVDVLRRKYPKFIYRDYDYKIEGGDLKISFVFEIPPNIIFRPKIVVKNIDETRSDRVSLDNLVFHIGLIEMLSYWKATCSPEIVVEAGYLDKEQIKLWKKLILNGMGQFFYENKIDWRSKNFLEINNLQRPDVCKIYRDPTSVRLKDRYLVPFAGGRDSIITLEGLKKLEKDIALFTVNPIDKIQKVVKVSGIKKQIIVKRVIDKKLLELNRMGYLNGHTPFTSVLSFISVLCAVLFNYKNIAFSNEKSANEGNVRYLGKIINHQWAKSSEFERMFRSYCRKYLIKDINYFSFTRKYGELEISKMLTKYPKYLPVFSSCNTSMRIRGGNIKWCNECPKCLFVYLTLYPYLERKQLLKIFGEDLLQKKSLRPILKSLIGEGKHKPFECVGTYGESRKALRLSRK
jgi:UDP-N-acetyl-alpha-D-muramoyl-L-alanyl-L-glutamate epimerase